MARAVQHIAFNCKDRIAQEKFYTQHFGCRRVRVFKAGQPDQFVMLRVGDVYLELFLNAHGTETGRIIDSGDQVPGLKVCFLRDPEGNVIELMEGWQDDPSPPQTP